ncbi:MAG: ABC transporter permease, partial [Calditrichaeota bacterium]
MFKNYLKITVRNLVKNKVYSSINIIGLAIGIASCLLIFLWVQKELSYDKFHKNAHRIYRVERELYRENAFSRWPITSGAYKQPLIDDFPEIENAVRFWGKEYAIHDSRGNIHRQAAWAVDNSIFQIFDFKLLQGDEQTALKSPYSLVLTREKAIALFGSADVVGKSLVFEWEDKPTEFKVAGILHDIPLNSHMQFNMLVSISSYPAEYFSNWRSNYLYTYVLLSKNVKWDRFEEKLKSFVSQRLAPFYGDLTHGEANIHEVLRMVLMPITHIHLHPSSNWEIQPGGNAASVFIFSSIALLILIIACINFINLSTARANKRAKEVGLRKSVGARNFQLQVQFILESILLSVISLVIAL